MGAETSWRRQEDWVYAAPGENVYELDSLVSEMSGLGLGAQ